MITFEEAVKASIEHMESVKDDAKRGSLLIASADKLGTLLTNNFVTVASELKPSYPSLVAYYAAFTIAAKACMDLFETKGPEGFAEVVKTGVMPTVMEFSENHGFLSKWYAANRKTEEDKHEDLS